MYSELYTDECQIGAFEKHFRTSFLVHAMAHGREVKCNSSSHPNLGDKMNQLLVVIPPLNFDGNPIRAVWKVEDKHGGRTTVVLQYARGNKAARDAQNARCNLPCRRGETACSTVSCEALKTVHCYIICVHILVRTCNLHTHAYICKYDI